MKITDENQLDSKSREYADLVGASRHERLHFPMSPRPVEQDDEVIILRLKNKLQGRGVGSWAASTYRGRTIKLTKTESGFQLEFRKNGMTFARGGLDDC